MMSLCCTSCSWEMSCCCCSCSWCRAGEDLARSDCSRWVCCTKFTCSCSFNNQSEVSIGSSINQSQLTCRCGTSCSSCLRPASAPCWTSCCSCAGWRLEKGELCTNQRRVLSAINQSQLTCSSWVSGLSTCELWLLARDRHTNTTAVRKLELQKIYRFSQSRRRLLLAFTF